MKYIYLVLIFLNNIYANDELNRYLNDEKYKYSIVKDEINNKIYIDLLYDKDILFIFTKNKENYKKTFNEKLYFCNDTSSSVFTGKGIYIENNNLVISCGFSHNNSQSYYLDFHFDKNNILQKIIEQDTNSNGVVIWKSIFTPKINPPTLKDFENIEFADNYIIKNRKDFIDKDCGLIILEKQALYKEANKNTKTNMYLVKNDVVEVIEEKEDWIYILYITKDKKEIKAWIPRKALEFKGSELE